MINSKAKKESDRKDKVIRSLTIFCIFILGLLGHSHFLLATVPTTFELHLPPDLTRGGVVKVNEHQKHEVYALALDLYQKLYRCEKNCAQEFPENIRKYGYFLTDEYRPKLLKQAKNLHAYNSKKRRSISEFGVFKEEKVISLGGNRWVVFLDVNEKEFIGQKLTRDAVLRYPVLISTFDVDRDKNPWRLALDGLQSKAKRLK